MTTDPLPEQSRQTLVRVADHAHRQQALRTLDHRLIQHMRGVIEDETQRLETVRNGFATACEANQGIAANTTTTAEHLHDIEQRAAEVKSGALNGSRRLQEAAQETERAQTGVQALLDQTKHIAGILAGITSLADQTNILALNATIEAARAGEAGKGFAVVASEVKSLSRQTHAAADTIEQSLGELNTVVKSVSSIVISLGGTMSAVAQDMDRLASGMSDMHDRTAEADAATRQLANTSDQVSRLFAELQAHLDQATAGLQATAAMITAGETATERIF